MKNFIHTIILAMFFITGCGYKTVKQSDLINFYLTDIKTTGNKRINYNLKNKLLFKVKDKENKLINLEINSQKIKSIKEKNIKNEITKYKIDIKLIIKLQDESFNNLDSFTIIETGEYSVADQHSRTLEREKAIIQTLSNSLIDKIIDGVSSRLNDI